MTDWDLMIGLGLMIDLGLMIGFIGFGLMIGWG